MNIKNRLSTIMGEKRVTTSKLAKKSGVSRGTLTRIYYGEEKALTYTVICRICDALGCSLSDLFICLQNEEGDEDQCLKK